MLQKVAVSFRAISEIATTTVSSLERVYKESMPNDLPSFLIDAASALSQRPQLPPAPIMHVQELYELFLSTQMKILSIILTFIKQAPNIVRSHGAQVCQVSGIVW